MIPLTIPGRLFLVRHGETDWNREGRLQGGKDIPLNALGRMQAEEAARRLKALTPDYASVDYLCSPMERARETMTILRRELDLPPEDFRIDERLRELTFGDWEGFTWREIRSRERELVRPGRDTGVELVVDGAVVPVTGSDARGAPGRQKDGVEVHGMSPLSWCCWFAGQAGTACRPARARAMMVFMIWAVPSPIWKPRMSRRRCSIGPRS